MKSKIKTEHPLVKDHYKFFYDEVTKRKIERHLSDINDKISDEDIMNVITDITSENSNKKDSIHVDYGSSNTSGDTAEEVEQMPTSWNIID